MFAVRFPFPTFGGGLLSLSLYAGLFAGLFAVPAVFGANEPEPKAPIEAAPNPFVVPEKYALSRESGPWLIVAMSLWGDNDTDYSEAFVTARKVANELRKKGYKAYLQTQEDKLDEIESVSKTGRARKRRYRAQRRMVAVLVGDYASSEDSKALKDLKSIKKLRPKVIEDLEAELRKAGAIGNVETPPPMASAFLSPNPLLSPDEITSRKRDPLLIRLNSGQKHSLASNKGKYSLLIATFAGPSSVKSAAKEATIEQFDKQLRSRPSMDMLGERAIRLCLTLRDQGVPAYVWHDRFHSLVTVGEFNDENDPAIEPLFEQYRAKNVRNPQTGKMELRGGFVVLTSPDKQKVLDQWVTDPEPRLIPIPKLK
jgi:hypothetical protein